ncbi:hypothetical protein MXD61_08360 [Frankia sp. AgPm24]|uniref:arsenate-mycothiol transferase ArsC n=1 Tax=Frankia sp. AgPm24 TaxID=631128 RepID=UPI00200FF7FF|nr:hypothetical protein [Frankia sp. AgPm24]MCK9921896.1 hypothetical protein [Frankia sp. AgPm24]
MTHAYPAMATAPAETEAPEVLFVCTRGAGRSPMGAALLSQHSHGRIQAHSAGTCPAPWTPPVVVTVMAELGIDLSAHQPTPLTDDALRSASVIITMGCGDAVPQYPHARYLAWEIDDPAGCSLDEVRSIRDEIDARVRALLYSLGIAARVGLLRGGAIPGSPDPDRPGGPGLVAGPRIVGDGPSAQIGGASVSTAATLTGQIVREPATLGYGGWPQRLPVPPPRARHHQLALVRAPQIGPVPHG